MWQLQEVKLFQRKHVVFWRKLALKIVRHILKKKSAVSYEERLVVAILQSTLRRSEEVSTTSWKYASWDEKDKVCVMDWPETKIGTQGVGMSFGPDCNWELDVIHSLASYLITNRGNAATIGGGSWIFPQYANLASGGAAAKATKIVKACYGEVSLCFKN